MTQATDLAATLKAVMDLHGSVGEIKGQMREVVHSTNNNTQALTHLHSVIAKMEAAPVDIAALDVRVTALEADKNRRDGAMGLGGWLIRVLPIGAISAAIGALAAFFTGKHP